jgi:hypothetical protein
VEEQEEEEEEVEKTRTLFYTSAYKRIKLQFNLNLITATAFLTHDPCNYCITAPCRQCNKGQYAARCTSRIVRLFADGAICVLETHLLNLITFNDALDVGMFTCTCRDGDAICPALGETADLVYSAFDLRLSLRWLWRVPSSAT